MGASCNIVLCPGVGARLQRFLVWGCGGPAATLFGVGARGTRSALFCVEVCGSAANTELRQGMWGQGAFA